MIISTDPRERTPLTFLGYADVTVVIGRFDTGYTLQGHERQVAVVRWSLKGLNSVHTGFVRRCNRINKIPYASVVFSGWDETPDEVRQAYVDCMERCKIPYHFSHDPEAYIYTFLTSYLQRAVAI